MIDHKTIVNRDAKAEIQLLIAEIKDDRKDELFKKYYDPDKCLKNRNSQKILIGNWLNNATIMLKKGATESEINDVVEHIVVLLHAAKKQLNVQKSYLDRNLLDLTRKYFGVYKQGKLEDGEIQIVKYKNNDCVLEKRKKLVEENKKRRDELREKIQNYLDSGCSYEYIANELAIPESTVRNIMKYHD
ncbi:MAG: hypothetical protein LIR46_12770 [Bacteroidota bacterium]|nr:hypothetical protein [Bacteroidota bacterium]